MKKLLEKDKNLRLEVKKSEKQHFILKSIFKNTNFFVLVRWKAFLKLQPIGYKNSKVAIASRCLLTINRKKFNKLTLFSRHIFLKFVRSGVISGMKKSSW